MRDERAAQQRQSAQERGSGARRDRTPRVGSPRHPHQIHSDPHRGPRLP